MPTRNPPKANAAGHTGVVFIASPLFSEAAASELVTRTSALVGTGALAGSFVVGSKLARDRASCAEAFAQLDLDGLDGLVIDQAMHQSGGDGPAGFPRHCQDGSARNRFGDRWQEA